MGELNVGLRSKEGAKGSDDLCVSCLAIGHTRIVYRQCFFWEYGHNKSRLGFYPHGMHPRSTHRKCFLPDHGVSSSSTYFLFGAWENILMCPLLFNDRLLRSAPI